MRTMRLRLFLVVALVVGLGLGGVWLLLEQPAPKAASGVVSAGAQHARAVTFDGSPHETRAGQEVRLDEVFGFNRHLAPWLSELREKHAAPAGESTGRAGQVASLTDGEIRGKVR